MTIFVNARAIVERKSGTGTEILLQLRSRGGEPVRWELPGGRINLFEPVLVALEREIAEETGLKLTLVHESRTRQVHDVDEATIETFQPFFAYQTLRGPIDSLGFFFRCRATGGLIERGDGSMNPTWFPIRNIEREFAEDSTRFDWLTQAALDRYFRERGKEFSGLRR